MIEGKRTKAAVLKQTYALIEYQNLQVRGLGLGGHQWVGNSAS